MPASLAVFFAGVAVGGLIVLAVRIAQLLLETRTKVVADLRRELSALRTGEIYALDRDVETLCRRVGVPRYGRIGERGDEIAKRT